MRRLIVKKRKGAIIFIVSLFFAYVVYASFDQVTYERRVVIKYAAPGSNPAHVNGFSYTIPKDGTFQVEIIPDRVSATIHGIPIVVDVAVGVLYEDAGGNLRRGAKKFKKGPWRHGIGNAFITFKAVKGQQIRVWYSASLGGMPCPDGWGKVRIFRIE
jgi:hypothetical protein